MVRKFKPEEFEIVLPGGTINIRAHTFLVGRSMDGKRTVLYFEGGLVTEMSPKL